MHGLNLYDYGARLYDPLIGQFTSIDPLCEKYYSVSPYAYCAGNPVNRIDPDGRKFVIYYEGGKYIYTDGEDNAPIPNDNFVRSVLSAYIYNKRNWLNSGRNYLSPSMKAASDKYHSYHIKESTYDFYNGIIGWNPKLGLKINRVVLSPATSLEHEIDHAYQAQTNNSKYKKDRSEVDKFYKTKEEKRVITGSEQNTAEANGEIKKGETTRKSHGGRSVIVKGTVSSTNIDFLKTKEYEEKRNHWTSGN